MIFQASPAWKKFNIVVIGIKLGYLMSIRLNKEKLNERLYIYIYILVAIFLIGCSNPDLTPGLSGAEPAARPFRLSSPRIVNNRLNPAYDAKGQVVFPDLQWEQPPSGTKSFLLIMEDRGRDTLAWYCGALGPDKTGLSRGDFEALQNGAGISWTEISKMGTFVDRVDDYDEYTDIDDKVTKLPREGYQFMAFVPGYFEPQSPETKTEDEYRITLFALNRNLQDWAGAWGTNSLLPSVKKISEDTSGVGEDSDVLSKFQEMLRGHVIDSKKLTFRASY